jgi:EAL domain-containing protein (putative c-di-GMP-specific phosphodiesterase class I)
VHSKEDRAIVQSILELAHSLGKEVVAEGVEDTQSLNILKEMKCNKIQGYHFAQPMAFEDFIPWLNEFESTRHKQR